MKGYKVYQVVQWLLKQDPQAILTIGWCDVRDMPYMKVTKDVKPIED